MSIYAMVYRFVPMYDNWQLKYNWNKELHFYPLIPRFQDLRVPKKVLTPCRMLMPKSGFLGRAGKRRKDRPTVSQAR